MTIIGIDSHKDLLAAARLDDAGRLVEYRPIENTIDGHRQVIDWLEASGCLKVAIEGSDSYGRPLALTLLAAGVEVVEVPPQMTAGARKGQRSNTKNDKVDATLISRIGLRDDDLPNPRPSGPIEDLRILVGYRRELVGEQNRAINRLHSDLEQIRVGYHRQITTRIGSVKSLQRCRNLLAKDRSTAARIARKRITSILALGREIDAFGKEIKTTVAATGTQLLDIDGIGPIVAADILTEVGDPTRFATKAKFAMANGTAPLEASSGRRRRHRLNRGGNRQLNKAIHIAANTQITRTDTEGRRYFEKRLNDGKTKREAIRALKRRIPDRIWTALTTPNRHRLDIGAQLATDTRLDGWRLDYFLE